MAFFDDHRRVAAVLLVVAALSLPGCSLPVRASVQDGWSILGAALSRREVEGLKEPGTLTVGIPSSSTAPFVVGQPASASGLDIELGAALADALGVDVSFVRVTSVRDALSDTCDVVMDVAASDGEGLELVGPYASSALAFFTKGEGGVVSADDLADKDVALQLGSAAQASFRTSGIAANGVDYPTLNDAFDALEAGEADYVLCHAMSGAYLASLLGDISFAGTLNKPTHQSLAVAPDVADAVREAYAAIEENGVLAETRRHWLGDIGALTDESQVGDLPQVDESQDAGTNADVEAYEAEFAWGQEKDGTHAGRNAITSIEGTAAANPNAVADAYDYPGYDAVVTYDTGTVYGTGNDSGYGTGYGTAPDAGTGSDTGTANDAGATSDAGAASDTGGPAADAADPGASAAPVAVDTGADAVAADAGVVEAVDAGV